MTKVESLSSISRASREWIEPQARRERQKGWLKCYDIATGGNGNAFVFFEVEKEGLEVSKIK